MATFTVEQDGTEFEVESISYQGQTVEEFYNHGGVRESADTPTEIEGGADESKIFVYEGEGVSLVLIHDYHGFPGSTESGGRAIFEFDSLPDGEWVVKDDPGDWDRSESSPPGRIKWFWNNRNTDGGAYRFEADEFSFTLTPEFKSGISDWELLSGDAEEPERINLTLDEPITLRGGEPDTVSASATTIAYVPGLDEDEEGYQKSAFPNESRAFPGVGLPFNPDDFYGDDVNSSREFPDEIPNNDLDAIEKKTIQDLGEFRRYRFANKVEVTLKLKDFTVPLELPELGSPFQNSPPRRVPAVDTSDEAETRVEFVEQPTETVINEGRLEVINENLENIPFIDFPQFDTRTKVSSTKQRYTNKEFLENSRGDVVGIRVSTIWGASNKYTKEIIDTIPGSGNGAGFSVTLQDNPIIYSWIEFVVLSNGTRYVRIPDHSVFPEHIGYLNGKRVPALDYGGDLQVFFSGPNSSNSGDGYTVGIDEDTNNVWETFKAETESGLVTPYRSMHNVYLSLYDSSNLAGFIPETNMLYGRDEDDTELPSSEVERVLPDEPLDAFS